MKVLLVSPLPPPSGGIATWTKEIIEHFNERNDGVFVQVINTALTGKRSDVVSNKRAIFDELFRTRTILQRLKRLLKSDHFDVIHINTSGAQFGMYRDALIARTAKKHGIPVVLQFRCNVKDQAEYNNISKNGFIRLVNQVDRVLVLNEPSLTYIKGKTALPSTIIPNFTVMSVRTEPKRINKSVSNVIFVGQVRRDKGIDELLNASRRFPNISFHLYGTVYEEYKDFDIPVNVILHGNVGKDGVMAALDEADVFVLPSYSEGFSNALVEAMARSVPCIATNVGANGEMLSGGCGVCIPPRNTESLVAALEELMSAETREKYARKALERCDNCYTREHVCEMLVQEWGSGH